MSIKEVIACDNPKCGKHKAESNHWFVLMTGEAVIPKELGWSPKLGTELRAFAFARMADVPEEHISGLRHYCSQGCITTVFQRWMDTGDIPEE